GGEWREENQPTDPFVEPATEQFLRERDTKNWVQEVGDLLQSHYPDAAALLSQLLESQPCDAAPSLSGADPDSLELLRRFGLIDAEGRVPGVLVHHQRRLRTLAAA
ncbi:MAG: hypothetical protein KC613_26500, partial [Myxococcales bacterium]|nr:hypothetical protein [Myxococcales bacterium]